jgi:hypothetical protein
MGIQRLFIVAVVTICISNTAFPVGVSTQRTFIVDTPSEDSIVLGQGD